MIKKNKHIFLKIIIVLFIIYFGLFIASESGYYEKMINQKVVFTSEAIKQFEKDVADGKNVDVNTYLKNHNQNYENAFSKAGNRTSEVVESFLTSGVGNVIDIFKSLFM